MNNSDSEESDEYSDALSSQFNGQDWQRREEVDGKEESRQEVVQNSSADTGLNEREFNSPEDDFEVAPELRMDNEEVPADRERGVQEADNLEANPHDGNQSDESDGRRSSGHTSFLAMPPKGSSEQMYNKIIHVGEAYQIKPLPDEAPFKNWKDIYPENFKYDKLRWSPDKLSEKEVADFLAKVRGSRSVYTSKPSIYAPDPRSPIAPKHYEPDHEEALDTLVFKNYKVQLALTELKSQPEHNETFVHSWTEDELQIFIETMKRHSFGKNFYKIQSKIPSKTRAQCVEFYYLFKKSPRYEEYKPKKRDLSFEGGTWLEGLSDLESENNEERRRRSIRLKNLDEEKKEDEKSEDDESCEKNAVFDGPFFTQGRALQRHIEILIEEGKSMKVISPDAGDENTPPPQAQNAASPTLHTQTPLRLTGRNVKANLTQRRGLERHIEILIEEGKSMEVISPDAGDENTPPPQAQNASPPTLHTQMNGY